MLLIGKKSSINWWEYTDRSPRYVSLFGSNQNRIGIFTRRIIYYYFKDCFKSSNYWRFINLDNKSSIIAKKWNQLWKQFFRVGFFLFHCINKSSCNFFWTSDSSANYYAECPCVISCFCLIRVVDATFCDYWHRNSFR